MSRFDCDVLVVGGGRGSSTVWPRRALTRWLEGATLVDGVARVAGKPPDCKTRSCGCRELMLDGAFSFMADGSAA